MANGIIGYHDDRHQGRAKKLIKRKSATISKTETVQKPAVKITLTNGKNKDNQM